MLQKRDDTYNVFMLRMALRDIIASVTAFLNCLRKKHNNMPNNSSEKMTLVKQKLVDTNTRRQKGNLPHSQVHWSNGKQWERVDLNHDGHEGDVQQNFDETWKTR